MGLRRCAFGKDGRAIWWWRVDLPERRFTRIGSPLWWSLGPDGWPLLALPLAPEWGFRAGGPSILHPPAVHLLEASTGREVHRITGLTRPRLADLNGDGLEDLWGEVERELRAFRGEATEAWRALGEFHPPEEHFGTQFPAGYPNVDFDGDGIGDALLGSVRTPVSSTGQTEGPGSYTALARSGRDGHVIWKTVLDPREGWFEPARGHTYGLAPSPFPGAISTGTARPTSSSRNIA